MLTKVRMTARVTMMVVTAVFFSTLPGVAADSSLIDLTDRINDLVYDLSKSVVTVEAYSPTNPDGADDGTVYSLVSSGIICDSSNRVLVMARSVADRELILIRSASGLEPADIIGVDYRTGLAVLEADGYVGPPATFANSFTCAGQMIVAVGNSYGISATPSIGFCAGLRDDGQMQFSAPITSGSIGGALFDMGGRLVGLITGGLGPNESPHVGLAMPGYRLPDIVSYLVQHGSRNAGFLGVSATTMQISPPIEIVPPRRSGQEMYQVGSQKMIIDRGVKIRRVVPASPAARGGLLPNDLVFSIDGHILESAGQLVSAVMDIAPGRTVPVGLLRDNQPLFITVEIGYKQLNARFEESEDKSDLVSDDPDAMRDELSTLKQQIQQLEERLNGIRK